MLCRLDKLRCSALRGTSNSSPVTMTKWTTNEMCNKVMALGERSRQCSVRMLQSEKPPRYESEEKRIKNAQKFISTCDPMLGLVDKDQQFSFVLLETAGLKPGLRRKVSSSQSFQKDYTVIVIKYQLRVSKFDSEEIQFSVHTSTSLFGCFAILTYFRRSISENEQLNTTRV